MLWRKFWKSNAKTNFLQTSVLFIKIQISWSQLKKNKTFPPLIDLAFYSFYLQVWTVIPIREIPNIF